MTRAERKDAGLIVQEVACRSILTRSGIDGVDYAVNPYVGCEHACVYCYATFMKRFTGHHEPWGTFVDVKVNAADALVRQIQRARRGTVNFGTVTDAYQPIEEQYRLTCACLEALADCDYPITILTKSSLVLRDIDLLARLPDVEVAFTISALDETLREQFEPGASPFSARLDALHTLADAGIRTWAFCGPLLPFLSDGEEQVDDLFAALKDAHAGSVLVDSLNLRGAAWGRVRAVLEAHYPGLVAPYQALAANRRPYHAALMERTRRIAARHDLAWREVRIAYRGD
ncbi:MAG: radical SAM protein [Anaerolineae bacterium]|nr:radical SAM protein [Anaerolineae bacterium]